MEIGIISDTHGYLSSEIHEHFKNVKRIFHAGDIGSLDILQELETIAPTTAVTGNMDDWNLRKQLPPIIFTNIENKIICLTHDIGSLKGFCYELFKNKQDADIIIHGHTHRPTAEMYQNKLFINPGSATHSRTQQTRTIALLDISESDYQYQFIELK